MRLRGANAVLLGFIVVVVGLILVTAVLFAFQNAQDAEPTLVVRNPMTLPPTEEDTPTPTDSPLPPTDTPTPTDTFTPTDTLIHSLTPSKTFTATLTPTASFTFTPSHTFTPSYTPTPTFSLTPTNTPTPFMTNTPTRTPIPGAVELVKSSYKLTNVLLIGSDRRPGRADYRTDVMVIVSVNQSTGTVNMLSFPRDLYVYIPKHGYDRLNTAALWGDLGGWKGGGIELLKETIRYNFGITIDHYALVNFTGFAEIVDTLGGVELVVECELQDYRLKSPDLNINVFSNYEWVDLPPGVYEMDGANALWYARSRSTTSDFDRTQRHQRLLKALWLRFQELDLWDTIPDLWEDFNEIVETDMSLSEILSYIPTGINLDPNLIENHFIGPAQVENYTTPEGAAVLKLRRDAVRQVVEEFYTPPTLNRLYQEHVTIEIVNRSSRADLDRVAASVLGEMGFVVVIIQPSEEDEFIDDSQLFDFTGSTKGGSLQLLARSFSIEEGDVTVDPDPDRRTDYRFLLGEKFNTCLRAPVRG